MTYFAISACSSFPTSKRVGDVADIPAPLIKSILPFDSAEKIFHIMLSKN